MSNCWNSRLEHQVNAVINGLGANDSSFLGEKFEPANTSSQFIFLNGLQSLRVYDDLARDVLWVFALESFDLGHN
jgi:hypothetical protein